MQREILLSRRNKIYGYLSVPVFIPALFWWDDIPSLDIDERGFEHFQLHKLDTSEAFEGHGSLPSTSRVSMCALKQGE